MRLLRLLGLALSALLLAPSAAAQVPCEDGAAGDYACENVMLLSRVDLATFGSEAGNDVWGWTDPETGREYALMGLADGIGFVDISDPVNPSYLGKLPTHTVATVWRDVKVYADHAFVASEADGHGIQVFDLRRLRDVAPTSAPTEFDADAHYDAVGQSHNIAMNEATGTAIVVGNRGERGCAGGLHFVDVTEPQRPRFAGCFADDGYTHDVQCVVYDGPDAEHRGKQICVGSNEDTVTIVDAADTQNPTMLGQAVYPNTAYTHQGWLTEDHRFFIANDELDEMRFKNETRTLIFDVRDLDAPEFVGVFLSGVPAVDHNLYVRGDVAYMANYRSGLRVVEIGDLAEAEMETAGYFDSFPADDDGRFGGAWSTYPYFESGNVLISDMSSGLFVVRPYRAEPLAATLTAFPTGSGALLQWTSEEDVMPSRFTVERMTTDGFVDVGTTRGVEGRDTYRLAVSLPSGEHTLRLRALDASGRALYSEPMAVTVGS